MRSPTLVKLLIAGALLMGCTRQNAQPPITIVNGDVASALAAIAARHHVPGLAAVALRGDQVVAQGVAGVRKSGRPELITLADKFHLGSDTKAMTATLAAMLVEEGKLSWTATLGELFSKDFKDLRPEWKGVTLEQVLAHRAGLPANPGLLLRARLSTSSQPLPEQRRAVVAEALSGKPEYEPGSKFHYSNTGYILLGAVIEQLTAKPWEDVLRERLFKPLGITSGGFGPPGTAGKVDQPWGHGSGGTAHDPGNSSADNPAFYGPAGAAHMTISDWAKFATLHLRGDPTNPHTHPALLKSESFAVLHTALFGGAYAGGWGTAARPAWGKGSRETDQGRVLTHAGSNTLWFCVVWLAPEIDFAVLVACNQGGPEATKACDAAAGALIQEFGRKPARP